MKEAEGEKDYAVMTAEELLKEIGKAFGDKDMKLMKSLIKLHEVAEKAAESAAKKELETKLQQVVATTLATLNEVVTKLIDSKQLDGADGIWYAFDFGEKVDKGINPSLKLQKSARRAASGTGTSTSSYVANPAKSADLLEQVGDHVFCEEDKAVRIDKKDYTMPAGMTFAEAYKFSANGGWRNTVRMALLKEAGILG